ncbi:MAG: prefoldin subunit beta [Candidatus Woesearchaeota archaeon]
MTEDDIKQMQLLEQNLQAYLSQKQQFQAQLIEINSAIEELEQEKDSFKIIGNIMVKRKPEDIKKELQEKKEKIELRIKSLEKQEDLIKKKSKELQGKVMQQMNEG